MSERINARIDDELFEALDRYARRHRLKVTEVIERALESFLSREAPARPPMELFLEAGLVGVARGPKDLSRNAKTYLRESLEKKK
jgi:predicted transcriptional regulator